jgi:hypothetical protein
VKFRGLDPDKYYTDENGTVQSGLVWMNAGINRTAVMRDSESFKVYLKEIER